MNTRASALSLAAVGLAVTGALVLPGSTAQAAPSASSSVRECGVSDLSVRYHATDAGMSHRYGEIIIKNVSGSVCKTGGYGGLSYVGHGDGTQIGTPASRDLSGVEAHTIVMKPGQHAVSQVSAAVADVYPRKACRPTHVDGFRVYVPDETHSVYIKHHTTGCASKKVHLLSHQAFS